MHRTSLPTRPREATTLATFEAGLEREAHGGMTMSLLDIRDELAATKNLAAALHMACDARSMPAGQRAALCEASNLVRERLEALIAALDQMLTEARA